MQPAAIDGIATVRSDLPRRLRVRPDMWVPLAHHLLSSPA